MKILRKCSRLTIGRAIFPNKLSGVSLVELMIAIALGLIVMLAVTTVFVNTSATRGEIEKSSRQIENGRYAMEVLSNDLQLAGFIGEQTLTAALFPTPDPIPDVCLGSSSADDVKGALAIHIQGINGEPACITSLSAEHKEIVAGTDILVIRRASTCAVADCPMDADKRFYIQPGQCDLDTIPFKVAYSNATSDFQLKTKACKAGVFAPIRKLYTHIYYISKHNKVAGDGVPTLKRLVLSGGLVAVDPIVEGVENLQVQYGVDTDNEVSPDSFVAAPTTEEWRNVTAVKVGILVRNLEKSTGYQQAKVYDLGGASPVSFNDGIKRHAYISTIRLTNVASRRE